VEGQLPWGAVEMDDDDQEEVLVVDDADDDVLLDEDKATESQMRSFSELFPHLILELELAVSASQVDDKSDAVVEDTVVFTTLK
jgi:hypothetical protein